MRAMVRRHTSSRYDALLSVLDHGQGGVFERLAQNRELLETLRDQAPGLLRTQPWVFTWLRHQEEFLVGLLTAAGPDALPHLGRNRTACLRRPWPNESDYLARCAANRLLELFRPPQESPTHPTSLDMEPSARPTFRVQGFGAPYGYLDVAAAGSACRSVARHVTAP